MVAKNGSGIVAMITNNSYIDGITHRQMRKHLLETFDKILILNLHGGTRRQAYDDDRTDANIFDIQQGVSIMLAVKSTDSSIKNELAVVYHDEIYGARARKFDILNKNQMGWKEINPQKPYYFFQPTNLDEGAEYSRFVRVSDLLPYYVSGIQTKNDTLTIKFSKQDAEEVVKNFQNLDVDELRAKYKLTDSSGWSVAAAKNSINTSTGNYRKIAFRPFDDRCIYYTEDSGGFIGRPRLKIMKNMLEANLGYLFPRQAITEKFGFFITDSICDINFTGTAGQFGAGLMFPIYIYHEDGTITPNFNTDQLTKLTINLTASFTPEDVLDYVYAVLHSPNYRAKYKEFLKIDFPRVPAPKDDAEFVHYVNYGRELRELHLMKSSILEEYITTYPESGNNQIDKPSYDQGRVYINDTQYFGNVPEIAWNFYIGGYQPAQKWLKDRKGRALTNNDLDHYQKIIKILTETDRIMKQIDV